MQPELQDCTPGTKVAIFQPELRPRTTFALKSCDFCLEKLPRTRRGSTPRPRDSESSRANHATTSKDHLASNKFARRHSESASTRTILAEGCASIFRIEKPSVFAHRPRVHPGMSKSQKNPSIFLDLDHTNLRRGSLAHRRNRKKGRSHRNRKKSSIF